MEDLVGICVRCKMPSYITSNPGGNQRDCRRQGDVVRLAFQEFLHGCHMENGLEWGNARGRRTFGDVSNSGGH